jgi:hypothetical protein
LTADIDLDLANCSDEMLLKPGGITP